jgi:hypothetical protein
MLEEETIATIILGVTDLVARNPPVVFQIFTKLRSDLGSAWQID